MVEREARQFDPEVKLEKAEGKNARSTMGEMFQVWPRVIKVTAE